MDRALLQCKNITKRFGGLIALSNLSFGVEEGSVTALIGPNGSGKTTTFNVINSVYPLTSGSIIFDGRKINGLRPSKIAHLGIGRTFQTPRLYKDFTALRNVTSGVIFGRGKTSNMKKAEEKGLELLKFVGLEGKENIVAGNLLACDKKLLEIARTLATEPKLLLLDECFAGLNEAEAKKAIGIISMIRERGITVFLIEHVLKVAMGIAERVIVINHGIKIAEGKPQEVVEVPEVIEAYLGESHA